MTNNYTEQIASILSGKLEIHKVSEEVIQVMLEEHPYSPYGHLVNYLKAKSQNRGDTQELLHTLATYSPDRSWLQHILNTTFKDIEVIPSEDIAIPSEAKDHNLDRIIFEFDFNQPIESVELPTPDTLDEEPIGSEEQVAFIEEPEPVNFVEEESSAVVKEIPDSFVSWLSTLKSNIDSPQEEAKTELPEQNLRSTEVNMPLVEKSTRNDNDLFGGIITETLAELLANQGATEKAISMYERLSLIFPNKSAFFAAKIEQLKSNITS